MLVLYWPFPWANWRLLAMWVIPTPQDGTGLRSEGSTGLREWSPMIPILAWHPFPCPPGPTS